MQYILKHWNQNSFQSKCFMLSTTESKEMPSSKIPALSRCNVLQMFVMCIDRHGANVRKRFIFCMCCVCVKLYPNCHEVFGAAFSLVLLWIL